jgi:uncharacterized protein involved in exopolysaccharide biosynthesis
VVLTDTEIQQQQQPPYVEEDEINLLDIFIVFLKYKKLIAGIVVAAGIAAIVISLLMTNIYSSESTIVPLEQEKSAVGSALSALGGLGGLVASEIGIGGTGSLEKFEVVLKSRELTNTVIQQHNLLPFLYENDWDKATQKWKVDKPPTFQDAYKNIVGSLLKVSVDKKKNVLKASFEFRDAVTASKILTHYIDGMSDYMRRNALDTARAQQGHLSQEMARTSDPILRTKLAEMLADQIQKESLAKVQKYYGFSVIDPPFVPEKKIKPKRAVIFVLSVVVAFFLAVFLAFFLEYMKNIQTREDPERLKSLKKYLKWRKA